MDFQQYQTEDFVCNESFQRFCMGIDEDVDFWEKWILKHPEKSDSIAEAKRLFTIVNGNQGNKTEQLQLLKDGVKSFDFLKQSLYHQPQLNTEKQHAPSRWPTWAGYTAGIAASIIAAIISWSIFFQPVNVTKKSFSNVPPVVKMQSGSKPRKTIVLPDNTVITLRENSFISLAKDFNIHDREVFLSGEAFFDVKHDPQHPFIVHTELADIKVLGTMFNVSSYENKDQMEAALFKGKIEVVIKNEKDLGPRVLFPNQKLLVETVKTPENKFSKRKIEVLDFTPRSVEKKNDLAWLHNRIEIENEPLGSIAKKLEDWYGINISFSSEEVKMYRYSGTFESETVLKALEALQLSYPFKLEVNRDSIIISK